MRPRQDMCADFVMGTANTAAWARFRPPGLPAVMRVEYLSDQWRCAKAGLGPRRLSNAIDRTTTGDLRYLAHPNTPQAVATERQPPNHCSTVVRPFPDLYASASNLQENQRMTEDE